MLRVEVRRAGCYLPALECRSSSRSSRVATCCAMRTVTITTSPSGSPWLSFISSRPLFLALLPFFPSIYARFVVCNPFSSLPPLPPRSLPSPPLPSPFSSMRVAGDVVLTGSDDWTARLWTLNDGECEATVACHAGPVTAVDYVTACRGFITGRLHHR